MKTYGQYCPISRSAELLGDRWTIHIIRDLLTGTSRFNEFVRGNPGLSRALLSRRLQQLRNAGVIEQDDDGTYRLTSSARTGRTRPGPAAVVAAPAARPEQAAEVPLHDLRQLHRPPQAVLDRCRPRRITVPRRSPIRDRRRLADGPVNALPHLPRSRPPGGSPPNRSNRTHRVETIRSIVRRRLPTIARRINRPHPSTPMTSH
jgi:hypothetical protein